MNSHTSTPLRLEGVGVYLRPMRPAAANEIYLGWLHDREVTRYMEVRFQVHTLESLRAYVQTMSADPANLLLAIVLKSSDRHIGNIKLGPINPFHRSGDIGLFIGEKECWGKGYATEAIGLLAEYAFKKLKLHKLTAGCYANNPGSAHAFEKAGFTVEAIRRSHYFCEKHFVDAILLGRLNPDEAQKT